MPDTLAMDVSAILLVAFIVGVPALAIGLLLVQLRRRRRFAYFRVVDEKTNAPLAGAEVFVVRMTHGRPAIAHVGGGSSVEHHDPVGTLDATGSFRGVFSASGVGALTVRGAGITSGIIGIESVSDYGAHPREPYLCLLRMGVIAPPAKPSAMSLGLAPGEVPEPREGYVNVYERPAAGDTLVCWPTLEEAKANNMSGSMARYWRARGSLSGPGIGGESFLIAIETAERVTPSS